MFQTGGRPILVARRVLGCPAGTGRAWIISPLLISRLDIRSINSSEINQLTN